MNRFSPFVVLVLALSACAAPAADPVSVTHLPAEGLLPARVPSPSPVARVTTPAPTARPTATPTPSASVAPTPRPTPTATPFPGVSFDPNGSCPTDTATGAPCVLKTTQADGRVVLSVAGNTPGDLTVDFHMTGTNLAYDHYFPRVMAPAGQAVLLGTVGPAVADAAWSYHYDFSYQRGNYQAKPDGTLYRLPYEVGTTHPVSQGWNGSFSHQGLDAIDWTMPEGTPVLAARGGLVVETRADATEAGTDPAQKDSYPVNAIYVRHDDGTLGVYLHLVHAGVEVVPGQRITTGQRIGLSGNTGYSSGPHLHFEVQAPGAGTQPQAFPVLFLGHKGTATGEQLLEGQSYTAF